MAHPASVTAVRSWPDFVATLDALADTTAKGDASVSKRDAIEKTSCPV